MAERSALRKIEDHKLEERRRDYVANEMKANPSWAPLVFSIERNGHPALLLLGYDQDSVLVTFERITEGTATKLMQIARTT